jgi:hypothetical protein
MYENNNNNNIIVLFVETSRGVPTNKTIICFIAMQTYKKLISFICCSSAPAQDPFY